MENTYTDSIHFITITDDKEAVEAKIVKEIKNHNASYAITHINGGDIALKPDGLDMLDDLVANVMSKLENALVSYPQTIIVADFKDPAMMAIMTAAAMAKIEYIYSEYHAVNDIDFGVFKDDNLIVI